MRNVFTLLSLAFMFSGGCTKQMTKDANQITPPQFTMHPIGYVRRDQDKTMIVIDKQYQPALLGLGKQKHVHVFYWFDKNDTPGKRAILQVHPRGNNENPLTGVFATRAPFRPNLIALSRCDIISVKDNIIEIADIDAFDDTPVIDLKGDFFYYYKPPKE